MTEKKSRGRPKGSEKDDSKVLAAVAAAIAANPGLKPTTAMRHHSPKASDADIRRWQDKWKMRGAPLLKGAQDRLAEKKKEVAIRAMQEETQRLLAPVGMEVSRSMREMLDTVNGIHNSPYMQSIRELIDSPTMRMIREMQKGPLAEAMKELNGSLSIIQEQQKFLRENQQAMEEVRRALTFRF